MPRRFVYELFERGAAAAAPSLAPAGDRPARPERATAPLTVSQAVRAIRLHLEQAFGDLLIEGEVSSLSRPGSGHWYFTLKDDRAQLPAVMFAGDNRRVAFALEEGLAVLARGRVTYYEGGGRAQLVVVRLEPAGVGARALARRQLAERLAREGLFDETRRRRLPRLPRCLGVVTSPTGAAWRDIVKVAHRRFAELPIVLAPTRVQGEGADAEIAQALRRLDESGLCDAIILGRGGGSTEDLEPFSSEVVVRAVAACATPVISAVGHEIDVALCDLAADARAATPSAAAELAVPERAAIAGALRQPLQRAAWLLRRHLARERLRVTASGKALADPRLLLLVKRQDLDRRSTRLQRLLAERLGGARRRADRLAERLRRAAPAAQIAGARLAIDRLSLRQRAASGRLLREARGRLQATAAALDALSPLAVLGRGYAICTRGGHVIKDAQALRVDDDIGVRLARGAVQAVVRGLATDDGRAAPGSEGREPA
ncbi:MAG: exodeoxyribonuclease VII large subunit [Deltaproteobacteria bacterium]|nr:exodeoxyribonuclease VII large subunit [Deltaproteobacteria bacterium]